MPDDVASHIRCILRLCRGARERDDALSRSDDAEVSVSHPKIESLSDNGALKTPSVVVLLPDQDAVRALNKRLRSFDGGEKLPERIWCTSLTNFAENVAQTHPAMENSTRIEQATEAGVVRDALSSIPDSVWSDVTGTSGHSGPKAEAFVRRLTRQVRELREHDVSPATLYAISSGTELTAAQRVLAIAYEAYDRYLLESPEHDVADLCGWATSQVRTGRVPWMETATFVAYGHVELSDGAASLLRAVRDRAHRFVQLSPDTSVTKAPQGSASQASASQASALQESVSSLLSAPSQTPVAAPPATVASRLSRPERWPTLDAVLGHEPEASGSESAESEDAGSRGTDPHDTALLHHVVSRKTSSRDGGDLSWITARDEQEVCPILREIQRMGWAASDIEVAVPAISRAQRTYDCAGGGTREPGRDMRWVSYASAGFSSRKLLVVLAMPTASQSGSTDRDPSVEFLTAPLRKRIASMTGTTLPAPLHERARDAWRVGHMLWRHGGEAIIVTGEARSALDRGLRHHLDPYAFQHDEHRT